MNSAQEFQFPSQELRSGLFISTSSKEDYIEIFVLTEALVKASSIAQSFEFVRIIGLDLV